MRDVIDNMLVIQLQANVGIRVINESRRRINTARAMFPFTGRNIYVTYIYSFHNRVHFLFND